MPEAIVTSLSAASEKFLSDGNHRLADEAVFEVFASMLGMPITLTEPQLPVPSEGEERTAIVGYAGAMRGFCEIQLNQAATSAVASAMLGTPVDDECSLDDAIGELANMIGGGWKDRVPTLSSQCALSPPTIIMGRDYKVHTSRPSDRLTRTYQFGDHLLFLTLRREHART